MRSNIHRLNTPLQITQHEIETAKADVEKKLTAKKLNISKTTDAEVEVLSEFVKMTLQEVAVDPSLELFARKATKDALAKGREAAAAICPICQESYGKKNKLVQCQFCAKSCCSQCCFKSRLDPQAKNAESAEKCLICVDCEDNYLNVQLNQSFRKEYSALSKLMEQLQGDLAKIDEEAKREKQRIEEAKPKEDQQVSLGRTMKLAKLKKLVQTSHKDIEKLEKENIAEREKTPVLEHRLVQKQLELEDAARKRQLLRLEELKRKQEEEAARVRMQQQQQERLRVEEATKKQEEIAQKSSEMKSELDQDAPNSAVPHVPAAGKWLNPTDEFEVLAAEKAVNHQSDQEQPPTAVVEQEKVQDAASLPLLVTAHEQSAGLAVAPKLEPKVEVDKPDSIVEEMPKSRKSSILGKSAEKKQDNKSKQPSEADKHQEKSQSETKKQKALPATENLNNTSESKKLQEGEKLSSPKQQNREDSEGKQSERASRTHSEYTPNKQDRDAKVEKGRPVSTFLEPENGDKPTEQEEKMLSRSTIVESDAKQESSPRRRPSRNMTEKEILNMRIPPPKSEKLFRESTDRNKLNASIKESSSNSLVADSKTTPLSKEEILRKSRNEDLEESQTPQVDEKSKCSCSIF